MIKTKEKQLVHVDGQHRTNLLIVGVIVSKNDSCVVANTGKNYPVEEFENDFELVLQDELFIEFDTESRLFPQKHNKSKVVCFIKDTDGFHSYVEVPGKKYVYPVRYDNLCSSGTG